MGEFWIGLDERDWGKKGERKNRLEKKSRDEEDDEKGRRTIILRGKSISVFFKKNSLFFFL